MKRLYPCKIVYKNKRRIVVWVTDEDAGDVPGEDDVFMVDSFGDLICAKNRKDLKKILGKSFGKVLWEGEGVYNFDRFWSGLSTLKSGKVVPVKVCDVIIDGWNFIEDVMWTFFRNKREGSKLWTNVPGRVYQKFFYGINLPAITPEGKHYDAVFTGEEIRALRKNMKETWKLLEKDPRFWGVSKPA
ncbi:MAG: hypothetical protein OEV59_09510 [Deltaproteobacteria bacterium]|nr:hypothetical protein [Deltaproteobacteria bacterium]